MSHKQCNRLEPAETYTHTHTHTHTCSLLLSFLSIFIFSSPSYSSGISSNASNATCNNSTLEKYSGSSNLTANWTGNHIDLYWYEDSSSTTPMTVASESQDCTYGGDLTPPANIPTKPGYTFTGWRVRQPVCQIPSSLANNNGSNGGFRSSSSEFNANIYGLTENNTWVVEWGSGEIVYGRAKCSALSGDTNNGTYENDSSNWMATETQLTSASGDAKYCWCKMTSYTPSGGNQCNIAVSSWVYINNYTYAFTCAGDCAVDCADYGMYDPGFRRALFGVSQ